jgi:hypothetical protein
MGGFFTFITFESALSLLGWIAISALLSFTPPNLVQTPIKHYIYFLLFFEFES